MIPCFTRNKAEYNVFNGKDPESEMLGSIFCYQFKNIELFHLVWILFHVYSSSFRIKDPISVPDPTPGLL